MSKSFMILFMVSLDTGLIENSLLTLNFYYCFFILLKSKFFDNGVNCVIPWWYWSIFGPAKEIWRVCSWSEMFIENLSNILLFDKNLSVSGNIIFSSILLFLSGKYDFHDFQTGLELLSTLGFSKYCNLAYLFRFATRFRCHLNFTMSLGHIWIVFETWSGHYLLPKVLIKMGFLILW